MNPDKQRIAIALACGWKLTDNAHGLLWSDSLSRASLIPGSPVSKIKISQCGDDGVRIPDYLNSLNAMHLAEKVLDRNNVRVYNEYLYSLNKTGIDAGAAYYHFHASAAMRAEAFLRTIGKWEEA